MTNVVHRRTLAWALGLWSGYIVTWTVATDSGPASVALWWLLGLGLLWVATQPLARRIPGLRSRFATPGPTRSPRDAL
jgi:hypothetical protein